MKNKQDNTVKHEYSFEINFQQLAYMYGETKRLMVKNIQKLVTQKVITRETEKKIYEGIGNILPLLNPVVMVKEISPKN